MPDYPSPPVHEVILDVQLQESLDPKMLQRIPELLGGAWEATTVSQVELRPEGSRVVGEVFSHWQSEVADACRWITRVFPDRLTLNSVRPGAWPSGDYVGWGVIEARWAQLVQALAEVFSAPIRRCGLRYVNKLAIPETSSVADCLRVRLDAPNILHKPLNFQFRQSWESIASFDDLGVNMTVALLPREQVPGPSRIGVLLDIDVFNFLVAKSPSWSSLPAWYSRAHAAENSVFESCISDVMRKALGANP